MNDLFGQPITEPKPVHVHGHAARPGTGPAGETCGTCASIRRVGGHHTFFKCVLIRPNWTHGQGRGVPDVEGEHAA